MLVLTVLRVLLPKTNARRPARGGSGASDLGFGGVELQRHPLCLGLGEHLRQRVRSRTSAGSGTANPRADSSGRISLMVMQHTGRSASESPVGSRGSPTLWMVMWCGSLAGSGTGPSSHGCHENRPRRPRRQGSRRPTDLARPARSWWLRRHPAAEKMLANLVGQLLRSSAIRRAASVSIGPEGSTISPARRAAMSRIIATWIIASAWAVLRS